MKNIKDFLFKRIIQGVFVVLGVITVVFLLRFSSPGNPAYLIAPDDASEELIEDITVDLGLDQPMHVQYVDYIASLLQGDFGYSYVSQIAVSRRLISAVPATLELAFAAMIFATIISIPLGIVSAQNQGTKIDYSANITSLAGLSTPNFWLGILLVLLFSVQLGILPTSTRPISILDAVSMLLFNFDLSGITTWVAHMLLPTIALGTYFMALIFRLTRSGILDELGKEYILAARAKGLPEPYLMYHYVFRNSVAPVITVIGLQLGTLIGGSVVIESVFAWPGVGTLFINGVRAGDWPTVQGVMIIIGAGYVVINLTVDVLYAKINPKVALS